MHLLPPGRRARKGRLHLGAETRELRQAPGGAAHARAFRRPALAEVEPGPSAGPTLTSRTGPRVHSPRPCPCPGARPGHPFLPRRLGRREVAIVSRSPVDRSEASSVLQEVGMPCQTGGTRRAAAHRRLPLPAERLRMRVFPAKTASVSHRTLSIERSHPTPAMADGGPVVLMADKESESVSRSRTRLAGLLTISAFRPPGPMQAAPLAREANLI